MVRPDFLGLAGLSGINGSGWFILKFLRLQVDNFFNESVKITNMNYLKRNSYL
jgi:hypothetical protein